MYWQLDTHQKVKPEVRNLVIYSTELAVKRINPFMVIDSRTVRVVEYQKAKEYLDVRTGEILTLDQAKQLGVMEIFYGVSLKQRQDVLEKLRPEIRRIALFVLKFRNKRRGITPDLDKVLHYYSRLNGKKYGNILRCKQHMYNSIMQNDTLCKPLFQFTGKNVPTKEHNAESGESANVLFNQYRLRYNTEETEELDEDQT